MNKVSLIIFFLLIPIFVLGGNPAKSSLLKKKLNLSFEILSNFHISDIQPHSATFIKNVKHNFIYALDPRGDLFSQQDTNELWKFDVGWEKGTINKEFPFFYNALNLYSLRQDQMESVFTNFNWSNEKTLTKNNSKFYHLKKEIRERGLDELKQRWEVQFHYTLLLESIKNANLEQLDSLTMPLTKEDFKRTTNRYFLNRFELPTTVNHEASQNFILDIICQSFDKYCNYFDVDHKKSFDESHVTSQSYLGFDLDETLVGEKRISFVLPELKKQFDLQVGDQLHSFVIQSKKSSITQEAEVLNLGNLMSKLYSKDRRLKSLLFLRTLDTGEVHSNLVNISAVKYDINEINTAILKSKSKDSVAAYLSIPSFYNAAQDFSTDGLSADVSRFLFELIPENVTNLIIDLRNNGGGSMMEANRLMDIFVDSGGLYYYTNTGFSNELIPVNRRGTLYNGKIIVLQNGRSASASEMFTQTLKDRGRCIVIGETSTGKFSSQIVIPLHKDYKKIFSGTPWLKSKLGYIKVTTGIYHSLLGKNLNNIGIKPDITRTSINIEKPKNSFRYYELSNISGEKYLTKPEALKYPLPLNRWDQSDIITKNNKLVDNYYLLLKSLINKKKVLLRREALLEWYESWKKLQNLYKNLELKASGQLIVEDGKEEYVEFIKRDIDIINAMELF